MPSRPLNEIANDLLLLRADMEHIKAELKTLEQQKKELEDEQLAAMQEMGIENIAFADNSFIIVRQSVANLTDWDALFSYVVDERADYLIQRRVAQRAILDAVSMGATIPGIDTTSVTKLSIRRR